MPSKNPRVGCRPGNRLCKDAVAKVLPKDKVISLHCQACGHCQKAADLLEPLGDDVRALEPGYPDLVEAGFPAAKGKSHRARAAAGCVRTGWLPWTHVPTVHARFPYRARTSSISASQASTPVCQASQLGPL